MADSQTPVRIPKGILKNKYGGNSRDGTGIGGETSEQIGFNTLNYGSGATSGWDPQLGMVSNKPLPVAPVPAPQHGMNMPNPVVLDPMIRGVKSEIPLVQQKIHEFINSKRDLLFRPLDPDETPVSEVKGAQRNTEDHYGIVPSFDHFLRIDSSELKRHFFQNAQIGDILIGKIVSRSNGGISMKMICTDGGKQMILDDLNVRSFCPTNQTIPIADPRDPSRYYDIDDFVRVEILVINPEAEKIITGMKGERLSPELQHSFQLGLIKRHDLPRYYTLTNYKHSRDPRSRRNYQEMLIESPGFQNPSSVSHLASNMGVYNNSNSLIRGIRNGFPGKEKASQLRRIQNAKWAHGHVAEGIKYFKAQKFTEAFQSLNNALNIDPENVEGLVARGALYANNGNYEKAIDDFESALKFNPNHFNARKYLAETLVALGRQQESQGKLEDAIASYSKSLVVRADHKEATEALLSLHARTEKLDPTKMTGPAAAKAAELKAKLKTILQGELGFKVESKLAKEKKSRKDKKKKDSSGSEDSSSSSSSDDSSSESSSSESGYKKKSKKRKKKKSKKSRKSRRESGSERKQKELSLSPFSKRLVEPHGGGVGIPSTSGFSGFTDSTYAELQLGIPKHDNDDSDNESKRSSKKSKDKKRSKKSKDKKKKRKRASSDSSSTDSESDRSKKKKKQSEGENASLQGIIPGLEDLEAKLSAYYSKIEQGKIETKVPPRRSRSRSKERERRSRSRSSTKLGMERNFYEDIPPRLVDNALSKKAIDEEKIPEKSWSERKGGKIDLQTDEYGNIVQPQTMYEMEQKICTVKNDIPVAESNKPTRFEMKFKPLNNPMTENENGTSNVPPAPDLGSKWRPLGAAASQSEAVKNAFERESSVHSNDDQKDERDKNLLKEDRNYRRRSRSRSLSRTPPRRRRRSRSYSRSLSRSRSRTRSYSRSRSRSRSPSYRRDRRSYRRDLGPRGRAPARFFRGYNYSRGRRSYNPRPYGRDYGGGGGSGRSRFRNRFSHTPSRSRSRSRSRTRSRSRSISPRDRRRDRSRDRDSRSHIREDHPPERPDPQSEDAVSSKMEADSASQPQEVNPPPAEIQIGTLKTTSTADVEYLLDRRNAEKKEEMRKSNPEFFRST